MNRGLLWPWLVVYLEWTSNAVGRVKLWGKEDCNCYDWVGGDRRKWGPYRAAGKNERVTAGWDTNVSEASSLGNPLWWLRSELIRTGQGWLSSPGLCHRSQRSRVVMRQDHETGFLWRSPPVLSWQKTKWTDSELLTDTWIPTQPIYEMSRFYNEISVPLHDKSMFAFEYKACFQRPLRVNDAPE